MDSQKFFSHASCITHLSDAVEKAEISVKSRAGERDAYIFRKYAFGEEGVLISASLIKDICGRVKEWITREHVEFDAIVAPEPGGLPWAMALSAELDCAVVPIRAGSWWAADSTVQNRYSTKKMSCNVRGDREKLLFVDDIVSSGETLRSCLGIVRSAGFVVEDVVAICVRGAAWQEIQKDCSVRIYALSEDNRPCASPKAGA